MKFCRLSHIFADLCHLKRGSQMNFCIYCDNNNKNNKNSQKNDRLYARSTCICDIFIMRLLLVYSSFCNCSSYLLLSLPYYFRLVYLFIFSWYFFFVFVSLLYFRLFIILCANSLSNQIKSNRIEQKKNNNN